jgi:hypothetical protein
VGLLALWPSVVPGQEDVDEFQREEPSLETEEAGADQPIAIELAQGIELLNTQIAQQQELLKTAQTEREKQLIHNHIRLLQKERRSLESLLHKLVGPNVDVLEAAKEQRRELQDEREQKQLERDERFPPQ